MKNEPIETQTIPHISYTKVPVYSEKEKAVFSAMLELPAIECALGHGIEYDSVKFKNKFLKIFRENKLKNQTKLKRA